jgi:hypothetical protein
MKMYNPQEIPQATMQWIMRSALNELNAFLCEGIPYDQNGKEWPADAREIAARCRAVAAAATEPPEKGEWLTLAAQYEDTI